MGRQRKDMNIKECTIKVDYPGSIISVNHYKYMGGFYTKKEVKLWMQELGWLLKSYHIEDWKLPLHVTCSGTFKDNRSAPDLSNLSKCVLDAIEEVTGINDRDMRWHDGERIIKDTGRPELTITIRESAVWLKEYCLGCGGNLYFDRDDGKKYRYCLQCGHDTNLDGSELEVCQ